MNTRKSNESPDQPGGQKRKIAFSDGLGWSDEHQSWVAHGRVGKKTFTVNTNKKFRDDAIVWLKNYKQDLKNQQETNIIKGLTVEAGLKLWAAEAPHDLGARRPPNMDTVKGVVDTYRLWMLPFIGKKLVTQISEQDLAKISRNYMDTPGPYGPHHPNGLRNLIIIQNTPLYWLKKKKKITRLVDLPAIPKVPKKPIVVIPINQVFDLLERYDRLVGYDIYGMVYIRMMAFTGIRTENARTLRKEQFNDDLTRFDTGMTKNDNDYTLPVPELLRDYLLRIPNLKTPGPLFPLPRGQERRTHAWCLKAMKRAARDIGITDRVAWHRLRATYATALIRAGADIFVLMEALGWETMLMALRYVKTVTDDVARAQERGINFMLDAQRERQQLRLAARTPNTSAT